MSYPPIRRSGRALPLAALLALVAIAATVFAATPSTAKSGYGLAGNQAVSKVPGDANHGPPGNRRGDAVGVMTRNVYLGADLTPAILAGSAAEFVAANGQILRDVTANDFPRRARGLAQEILSRKPDLVGLQEVALWRTGSLGGTAGTVRYDYLELLLDELNRIKDRYRVVVVQEEFDFEAPADEIPDGIPDIVGRLTMRDVILARRGAGVRTWHAEGGKFENLVVVPTFDGGSITVDRGWTRTNAKVRHSGPFRFVNTHLESIHPGIRALQAGELVDTDGPATTSGKPVVLVGDLNSDDDTVMGDDRLAYLSLLAAGMVNRSTDKPLSCCLNSSLLAVGAGGSNSDFDHQVDHVLTRNPEMIGLRSSTVTGRHPVRGIWSSDHAGVFSALKFR